MNTYKILYNIDKVIKLFFLKKNNESLDLLLFFLLQFHYLKKSIKI
jgi:hypothetical protein